MGKERVREELQYIPAQLKLMVYMRESYECPACKHTDSPYIIKTVAPRSLMNHSLASPSSVAYVMYQKYMQGVPLKRQEKIGREWESCYQGRLWLIGSSAARKSTLCLLPIT